MKKLISLLAAAALCAAMTGCSDDGGDIPLLPFEPSPESSSISDDSSDSPPAPDYSDVELPFAAQYYLKGESDNTVTACKALIKGAEEMDRSVSLRGLGISSSQLGDLISLVVSTVPELTMVDSEYSYSTDKNDTVTECRFNYLYGEKEREHIRRELDTAADVIVGAAAGLSDFDKLLSFHDAIIRKCTYTDRAESPYTAYGCLVEGEAVCEGYSKAFMMLCQRSGIDCLTVYGTATRDEVTAHMWNKVRLDGEWYNFDITWDDPVSSIGRDYIGYDYFAVSDRDISVNHEFDETGFMKYPDAVSDSENYFVKNGLYITDISEADSILLSAITDQLSAGSRYVQVKCSSDEVYNDFIEREFGGSSKNARIFDLLAAAAYAGGPSFDSSTYSVSKDEGMRIVTLILEI